MKDINWGITLLALWLIFTGLATFVIPTLANLATFLPLLAMAAGVLLLLKK